MIPAARPEIGQDEIDAVVRVLRTGRVVQGPEVADFEQEFGKLVDGRACVAVNSGTSALHLSMLALGIGPGDEVVVPSFSFAATANAVAVTGAAPVFADIDPDTFCLDPESVASVITPRTVAIVPVHLFGHPAAMDELVPLAGRHGLAIVEDAAQAVAARLGDTPVGAFGDTACFSFYPTKNMHSLEGGMIVTGDPHLERKLRLLRNQGMLKQYENEVVGLNNRMTDVGAAVGRVQLAKLDAWTQRRRQIAARYDAELTSVRTPKVARDAWHVYHQYTITIEQDRDGFRERLAELGVGSGVYYPTPIHRLAPYSFSVADLPVTERAAETVLSLPVYPLLDDEQVGQVIEAVNSL
ncbi:DegT/DnrJ/EryC1/StrS family aminotransferase [Actinospica sp. MGRD01-02]|uniref:DegT/DnrJ/EryC1/StrS family aminotransferase n=1 Tax=Actinospica acidithermotolerans TaxID=2828514 RepID=A0A941IIM8_9ACTN|nr:DegT/DnrJ/EryC1/StrS family aminotransferase [Actinospica acidithermotolerans]MBR7828509.1 DegT/DnrJ/EryC1/StrS family aminotransferase [Actinospica acidithermotolerans]